MPYASNIQVVTDANGTALAFLVEDGRIWQCQWNSEAQRWDKGTIVPDAFGGEKVQALVLPRFWTTANNGGTTPTTWDPGLVLAYRVGQGAEAGISASFGRWNEAGQLVWTAPVRLSQEQSGAGEFSLVAGDNSSFNLVVQQTAGAAPVSTVLDTLAQQAGGDAAAVRDQLATTITSTTPDSDLYNYRFRIDASGNQLEQLATAGGSWKVVSTATNPLKDATVPPHYSNPGPLVGGNSQITRGDLYALGSANQATPSGASLLRSTPVLAASQPSAEAEPAMLASSATVFELGTAGWSSSGRLGTAFAGFKGQDLYRYKLTLAGERQSVDSLTRARPDPTDTTPREFTDIYYDLDLGGRNLTLDQLLSADLAEMIGPDGNVIGQPFAVYTSDATWLNFRFNEAERTEIFRKAQSAQRKGATNQTFGLTFYEDTITPKASYAATPTATLKGAFGALQGGISNLQSVSFAKFVIGKGNDDANVLANSDEIRKQKGFMNKDKKTISYLENDSVKMLKTLNDRRVATFRQAPNAFAKTTYNWGLGGSLLTAYNYGKSDRLELKSVTASETIGVDALIRRRSLHSSQLVSTGVYSISSGFYWKQSMANPGGALPVYAGVFGLLGIAAATGLNAFALRESATPSPTRDAYAGNTYGGAGAGAFGALSSMVGPLSMWLDPNTSSASLSNGVQLMLRYSGSILKNGIAGIDWNLISRTSTANEYSRNPGNNNAGFFDSIDEQIYADAGVRIIGGARIPLLSYYTKFALKNDSGASAPAAVQVQATANGSNQDVSIDFTEGEEVPFAYLPSSGSTVYAGSPRTSTAAPSILDAKISLLGDAVPRSPRRLQLNAASLGGIVIDAIGANLNDGVYPGIRILGVPLVNGEYATVDVTISNGNLAGLSNLQGASYVSLPETSTGSGKFYLPLDVFQAVEGVGTIATPPQLATGSSAAIDLPVLSIRQGSGEDRLLLSKLLVCEAVQVDFGGEGYSRLNPSADQPSNGGVPATNNNLAYVYEGVPLLLTRNGAAVNLIGFSATKPATATVRLVGGSIQRIDLEQPLYLDAADLTTDQVFGVELTLPAGIAPTQPASLTLRTSAVELNNLVQDGSFSAQQGATDTGVFITEGRSDELALFPSDGYKRLQNRVAYTTTDANKNPLTVYLNTQAADGSNSTNASASAEDLSNERIVANTAPEFSFASNPTAISIAGEPNADRTGWTLVAWVQAGDPLIPYSTNNGAQNYQNYLTAAYGSQSINYRVAVKGSVNNWSAPDASLNYRPDNAIITNLQAFNLPNPARGGRLQTLLTWSEIKISAIKGLTTDFGSGLSLPATIKATWIDADSASIDWTDLSEGVIDIPWDPATSVGMGIADLTASSQTIKLADGSVQQAPVLSWSQTVRTPYQQSVLLDEPTLYLPMANLQPGLNDLNLGSTGSDLSLTTASATGLDYNVAGALAVEQTTAVRNIDGSGNLSTGLGSSFSRVLEAISQVPLAVPETNPTPPVNEPPVGSAPYSIECWVQLQPDSNPDGAGIVAFGQPSETAVGKATLPHGWTLTSSFLVDRITYKDAASLGLITEIPEGKEEALYQWNWSLVADGANTTAADGNGGSNLYSNALSILNLFTGVKVAGVDAFLASYGLSASQLQGFDGTTANTMALVPSTVLQFTNSPDPLTLQPSSKLNTIALDPTTTLLNSGVVSADAANADSNLAAMFQSLWNFQQQTNEAKVRFDLAPPAAPATTSATAPGKPNPLQSESYSGYGLGFGLWGGPAISVDGNGQLIFDASQSLALGSGPGTDLRDGAWHAVTATYTPDYILYTQNGKELQLPTNNGTARLYIDGKQVSEAAVSKAFLPINANNQAVLLANNAGGAIDHVALYNQALTLSPLLQPDGSWPTVTAADAFALLAEAGLTALPSSPDPGERSGAVSQHWLARTVNPKGALNATYTASLLPADGGNSWQWSEASGLDPVLELQPTQPSAYRGGSVADALSLRVSPEDWAKLTTSASSRPGFNPSGQILKSVQVTVSNLATGSSSSVSLRPDQVLVGDQTIASLQPRSTTKASLTDAQGPQLQYSVLNATPELTLLIPRDQLPQGSNLTATYALTFASNDSGNLLDSIVSNPTAVSLNTYASYNAFRSSGFVATSTRQEFTESQAALATASVIEAAPLQLKYINSGIKLSSEISAAAANTPAATLPAQQFGVSQVSGSYTVANDPTSLQRGWLAVAQPVATNAATDPAGRVWVNYSGMRPKDPEADGNAQVPVEQAPTTWLNALASSNFDPERPNLPLLNDPAYASQSGGLLIKADPTLGLDANLGQTMTSADLDNDGLDELIIAAPNANGGGCVYIIAGKWIANNLNSKALTLDLNNPNAYGSDVVTILRPQAAAENPVNPTAKDIVSFANFGTALAVDPISKRLWIGAPDYVRQLPLLSGQTDSQALQTIGALYSFSDSQQPTGGSISLAPTRLGSYGKQITPGATDGSETTNYWGARLGAAIAISAGGQLAVSAPGVPAAMEYSGTDELIAQTLSGQSGQDKQKNWGALIKANYPSRPENKEDISELKGTNRNELGAVAKDSRYKPDSAFMQKIRDQILKDDTQNIATPTVSYNQALQNDAVGAVYLLSKAEDLISTSGTELWASDVATLKGATFYGNNPWNTLGATGFGSSLGFADLANTKSPMLLIGANAAMGRGGMMTINAARFLSQDNNPAIAIADQPNTYIGYQAASLLLQGAADLDQFGHRIVSLGDVNDDNYDDVLITAPNARGGAGSGYLLFGSDQLLPADSSMPLFGSVAPGAIGTLGTITKGNKTISITTPILEQIGYGGSAQTGSGNYGPADVDGDGLADVLLGSPGNGSAYITWGQPYLEAISSLALDKLSSSNGYLLEGLASKEQGSLRAIGDFNFDGYGDFISIQRGPELTTVRLQLGANTQEVLAEYPYNFYSFTVSNDTEITPIGDSNGDGFSDLALFIDRNYSGGSQGAGSTTGILYGRRSAELPLGSGFGLLAPEGAPMPQRNVVGGLTDATPAFLTVGDTIYTVVKGVGNTDSLWFNQSRDGGSTWDSWTNLTSLQSGLRIASGHAPTLAWHEDRLVLGLLDPQGQIILSSWDPASAALGQWTAPFQPRLNNQPISASQTPQLLSIEGDLALIWAGSDGSLQSSYSTDALGGGDWLPATSLQERLPDGSSAPIRSLTAPSLTSLGDGVLAMAVGANEGGSALIRVLTSTPGSVRWSEASRFAATAEALTTGPSLASTDTGLALTYGTAGNGVLLQRLDLIDLEGNTLNTAADLEPLIQQTWQPTTLSGLTSAVGSVPLMVNGTLLLGNVRADAAQNTQIWLNAIAAPQRDDRNIWIDTTLQLPDGNGGWLVQQQAGADHPVAIGVINPGWETINNGLSPWAPSFAELNGVLYSAVRGWNSANNNRQLYWNRSTDNGRTWSPWQQLPGGMTSDKPPTVAAYNGTLYLVYIGQDNDQSLNITKLENANTNQWASQRPVRAGGSNASNQSAEFATLLNEGNQLALYYVGTGLNDLYSTSSTDPYNTGNFTPSTLIKYKHNDRSDKQTASGPLAATRLNGQTYLAYQGGTYRTGDKLAGKSNQIFLTTGSANETNWTMLNPVPQPASASHTGVGLTANSKGLVLSYSDVVNGRNVVSVQQGTGSGTSWSFSPYTVLQTPGNSSARNDGANSLYARTSSDQVLVGRINPNANEAITNVWAEPLPPSLVLTPGQTRSTLIPVGDITGDGFSDALITAANVVLNDSDTSTFPLQTGVRLLSGAATSAAFRDGNDNNASSQTLQLAPAFSLSAETPSTTPTAAGAWGTLPQLTIAANAITDRSRISTDAANQSLTNFSASASTPSSLRSLFGTGATPVTGNILSPSLWGKPELRSSRFGDLNGDGRLDYLAADGLDRFQTANGALNYTVWDIRAAGDANGNGLDDVLVALVPQGPAYRPNADGSPSVIQPVLLDGALFEVDANTNTFTLDSLKAPLNPYTQAEVFDLSSTSSKDYLPPLQAWIEPILTFKPGTLSAASAEGSSAPGENSASAPLMVVDEHGREFLVYTSGSSSGSVLASQLRLGYRVNGSWTSRTVGIGVATLSAVTPSAVFYGDRLFVAYADQNGAVRISHTTERISPDSDPATWTWSDFAVSIDGSPARTLISPTLVANHGVLTLILPGAVPPVLNKDGSARSGQQIQLASSNNPEDGAGSSWGSSLNAENRFSGPASVLKVEASGGEVMEATTMTPVAATVFQGQTVLAYQPKVYDIYDTSTNSPAMLATEPLGSAPGAAPTYTLQATPYRGSPMGVTLASDQSLLYLGTNNHRRNSGGQSIVQYWTEAQLTAFAPASNFQTNPATWIPQEGFKVGNIPDELPSPYPDDNDGIAGDKTATILGKGYFFTSFFGLAMRQGSLVGTWREKGLNKPIQAAVLNTTITAPAQQSLAGYSIDGGIDINGDGFADSLISDPSDPSQAVDNQYALFGGDYLNIATQVGTTGDDVMLGTALADVIYTLSGSDRVDSRGGRDVILTASGDDLITIMDNRFQRIDAGPGFDTLLLHGMANQRYDFRLNVPAPSYYAGTKLQSIEAINSADYGSNLLAFDGAAVSAFNANRFLFLTPDASDSIVLSSEFKRNTNFDAKLSGVLWSAFTAGPATATPGDASPAVIYVLNPEPLNPNWLAATGSGTVPGVRVLADGDDLTFTGFGMTTAMATATQPETSEPALLGSSNQGTTTAFGKGLAVTAFSSSSNAAFSRFIVSRQDSSSIQVVFYGTNPLNSRAVAGRDHPLATGTLVFQPGETSKEITVPWTPGAFQSSRGSSISLELRELPYKQQKEVHVLVESLPDARSGKRPTLSGISVTPSEIADNASISLRADVNNQDQNQLRLRIGLRSSAAQLAVQTSKELAIRDFNPGGPLTLSLGQLSDLPIDRDERANQQIGVDLKLNLLAAAQGPAVSLLGPAFLPAASVETVGANQVRFLQDAPLTTWRSDSGSGRVSFGLRAGTTTQALLSNAAGGSAGSINPSSALDNNPTTGWLASEGRAIGSRSINTVPNLTTQTWTPTATRDGIDLPLLGLTVNGNQITARFTGGVTAELWQASGSAPAQLPVAPSLEVQRLAGFNNDIGLYSVDGITGMVDGLNPRDPGYLQAALARSEAEDLLLTAAELPAFGKTTTYNSLPINSQKRYGVLLVQNGNRSTIFSSFSDANPGAETQMVRLGSDTSRFVLGIEDIAVASGRGDRDFNDNIVILSGISLGIL